MWHAWIEFGGYVFWALIAVLALGTLWCVSRERWLMPLGLSAGLFLVLFLFCSVSPLAWLGGHWVSILGWVGIYLAAGVAWAVSRWLIYAVQRKHFFYVHRDAWHDANRIELGLASKDISSWEPAVKIEFLRSFTIAWNQSQFVREGDRSRIELRSRDENDLPKFSQTVLDAVIPKVSRYKGKITVWTMYWPFSILCYLLEDAFREVVQFVVQRVSSILTALGGIVFARMKRDLKV